jgi:hypothetical protein
MKARLLPGFGSNQQHSSQPSWFGLFAELALFALEATEAKATRNFPTQPSIKPDCHPFVGLGVDT